VEQELFWKVCHFQHSPIFVSSFLPCRSNFCFCRLNARICLLGQISIRFCIHLKHIGTNGGKQLYTCTGTMLDWIEKVMQVAATNFLMCCKRGCTLYLLLSTHCSLLIPHLHGSTLFVKLMIKFLQVKDLGIFWWRTVCFVRLLIAVWFVSLHRNMLGLTFVLYSSGFWHRFWAF
jgi:hypothetical protein